MMAATWLRRSGSPSDISGYPRFVDVTKVELARPPILADAHYLLLLLSAVQRMQHWRKAALVCSQLLRLDRSVSGVDVALLWMMLARIYDALGDTEDSQDAANAASAVAMFVDGNCDAINADDEAPTVPTPGGTISEDTPWQQGCLRTGVCCALELATPIQSAIMDISDVVHQLPRTSDDCTQWAELTRASLVYWRPERAARARCQR